MHCMRLRAAAGLSDAGGAAGAVARALTGWLLAAAIAVHAGPLHAAGIALNSASATDVTATITPDASDVGKQADIWIGAVYQGEVYLRDGSSWVPYTGGTFPIAISGQILFPSTVIGVVQQLDISSLVGLELYVGYGSSEQDMLTSPGKLEKVYTVPAASPAVPGNVVPISVDSGPLDQGIADVPYISVTVCAPGSSSNCQTIDHVIVDTGSTGLRLISSVVSPSLGLPYRRDSSGNLIGECVQFADGTYLWGSVRVADVRIGGETAASVPIQLAGDPAIPAATRATCSGTSNNTVQAFGANGIIGVGHFRQDCGPNCAQNPNNGWYYVCSVYGCSGTTMPTSQQVVHPVSLFPVDNNGVVIQLPAIPPQGVATATGSLIFGIGTEANNGLGAAKVLTVDPTYADLTTDYAGQAYSNSYIDSGSSALFLPSGVGVPSCPSSRWDPYAYPYAGFLCPSTALTLSAVNQGGNGQTQETDFSVGNAASLLSTSGLTAFSNLAAPNSDWSSFDWGLPFFFGRRVYTAIEGANTPGGVGPYVAY